MAPAPFRRHYRRYDRAVHPLIPARFFVQESEATSGRGIERPAEHEPVIHQSNLVPCARQPEIGAHRQCIGSRLLAKGSVGQFVEQIIHFGSALVAHLHLHDAVIAGVRAPDPMGSLILRAATVLDESAIAQVPKTTQRAVTEGARKAQLPRPVTCHKFPHFLTTHLPENGTDIPTAQELIENKDVSTPIIYTCL
jgi:hypothetical protein